MNERRKPMKRIPSFILALILILSFPLSIAAEEDSYTLEITPPTKLIYQVGEKADYTGGSGVYTAGATYSFNLDATNCSGFSTVFPGIKTVTVRMGACKAYFSIVVLRDDEPILNMKDIKPKHWSYRYFGPIMKAEIFEGDTSSKIRADAPITRAEMAALLYRAWRKNPSVMTDAVKAEPFVDVKPTHWAYDEILACQKAGIIKGVGGNYFKPNTPISRQDAVLMLMRIRHTEEELAAVDVKQTVAASGVRATDFSKVADYAKAAVALSLGDLIQGNPDGTIAPRSFITRAATAVIFYRLFFNGYVWVSPVEPILIYLSPSRQFANRYAAGNTNEGDQMYRVAERVRIYLEAEGYDVVVADKNRTIYERTPQANTMEADLYIPIHSNAGGGVGTRMFYNGARKGSYELSRAIFDELSVLTNTPLTKNNLKEDYLCLLPNGSPFHEIAAPNMPMAYIEVEFHDIKDKARWIINNTDPIAKAIADGIIAYCEKYL